jgi:MinD-like ATPase involved in chromosome partitioning or flagellar assembly
VEHTDADWSGSNEAASRWRSLLDRRVRARSTLPDEDLLPRTAPAQAPTRPDGRPSRPDGTLSRPDGLLSRSDGLLSRPEGRLSRPDGLLSRSDGLLSRPDGQSRAEQARPNPYAVGRPAVQWQAPQVPNGVDRLAHMLRADLGAPRVVAFANPKGGVHKTTATVLCAAAVGGVRGRGVIAWDDNELRGTLGLRAGSARHARTIRHLIADIAEIEASHGSALADRLDDYLRHASDATYDVLAGEENPTFAQQLDPRTVRRVLELLRRTHDVICVDTGNNVESANWQTVLQAADQLVVTTVPREDAAFTADWMLDLLEKAGMGDLVSNAVTLLSCPTPRPSSLLDDLSAHFATRTRAVAVVPYDPALESGSSIEYSELQSATKRAWLQAASVILEPYIR